VTPVRRVTGEWPRVHQPEGTGWPARVAPDRAGRCPETRLIDRAAQPGEIAGAHAASLGDFEQAVDVGKVARPGSSAFDSAQGQYRITGSGHNIWGKEDAFHFLHKNLSGDLAFTMDVAWEGAGQEAHRKVGAMVRQGLGADAPYVDIAVHGDGLIELQYRKEKGGETVGVRTGVPFGSYSYADTLGPRLLGVPVVRRPGVEADGEGPGAGFRAPSGHPPGLPGAPVGRNRPPGGEWEGLHQPAPDLHPRRTLPAG